MKTLLKNSQGDSSLDLSSLGLTSLPENLPEQLQILNVSNNELTSLPQRMPVQLQELDVSYNQLLSLPKNLPEQLQILNVSDNQLTSLPEMPDQLQKLDASHNQLTSLPENLPEQLQILNISNNELTSLPEMPDQLQKLDAACNQLTSLPENLPASLQKLNVSHNELTSLPQRMPVQLQALDAIDNRLTSLPEMPDQLQELDVFLNQLLSLPENLPGQLQILNVSYNRLTSLPEMPDQLQKLDASHNQLTSLPEMPDQLQELNVIHNQLTSLPQRMPVQLQELGISYNQLLSLPENLPEQFQELNVSYNQLLSLPENLPEQLQKLNVSYNQLLSLPENLPERLQRLNVSFNRLTSLPENLPASLKELNAFDNQLTSLPEHIATTLRSNCRVILENNPLPERVRTHLHAITTVPDYQGPRFHFSMAGPSDTTPARPLANAVADWHDEGREDVTAAWSAFGNEDGAPEFSRFLDRLRLTVNYANPQFRQGVVAWLSELAVHPTLRKSSFVVSVGATASCEDRVSLTYNDMKKVRLVSDVENGRYDDRLGDLVQVARGMYRLDQLETIAREKVKSLHFVDEIEVYLAYQVKLREPLQLPVETPDMRFFGVSWVTDDDLSRAEAQVKANENAHFINYLSTDWKPWEVVAKRLDNTGFEETQGKVLEHIEASFDAQLRAGYAELDRKIDDASHRREQLRAALPDGMPEAEVKARLKPIEQEREEYHQQVQDLPAKVNKDIAYSIRAEAARALLQERGLPLSLLDPQW